MIRMFRFRHIHNYEIFNQVVRKSAKAVFTLLLGGLTILLGLGVYISAVYEIWTMTAVLSLLSIQTFLIVHALVQNYTGPRKVIVVHLIGVQVFILMFFYQSLSRQYYPLAVLLAYVSVLHAVFLHAVVTGNTSKAPNRRL